MGPEMLALVVVGSLVPLFVLTRRASKQEQELMEAVEKATQEIDRTLSQAETARQESQRKAEERAPALVGCEWKLVEASRTISPKNFPASELTQRIRDQPGAWWRVRLEVRPAGAEGWYPDGLHLDSPSLREQRQSNLARIQTLSGDARHEAMLASVVNWLEFHVEGDGEDDSVQGAREVSLVVYVPAALKELELNYYGSVLGVFRL